MDEQELLDDEVDTEETELDEEEENLDEDLDEDFDDEEENVDEEDNVEDKIEEKPEKEEKKQSRKENQFYAEKRRETEKLKKEQEMLKKQGILEGIKIAYNGVNKFTNKELVDEHDVEIFRKQLELEKVGKDPIQDLPEYLANEEREIASKVSDEEAKKKWYTNDFKNFVDSFNEKEITLEDGSKKILSKEEQANNIINELNNDMRFAKFSKGKVGIIPLKEIYNDYLDFMSEFEANVEKESRKKLAKAMSSPRSTQTNRSNESGISIEKIKNMSQKELNQIMINEPKKYEKIIKAYDMYNKR